MKGPFFALLACTIAFAHPARADLTIVQRTEGMGQTIETTTRYKDGLTRVDVMPGGVSIIVDSKTGETINLQHAQKHFLRTPNTVVKAAVDSMKIRQPDGDPARLTPTGRAETISGFQSQEYAFDTAGSKISIWLTHDVPDYERAIRDFSAAYSEGPLAAMMQTTGIDMSHLPGFPVRIVREISAGTELTTTLVSVSMKAIDDSEFAIPAGYTQIIPQMPMNLEPDRKSSPSSGSH